VLFLFSTKPHYTFIDQWSFRKTGTMGTLASQSEIGASVQALWALPQGIGGIAPEKFFEIVYAKS